MSTATVLIIDGSSECSLSVAKALMPEGISILAASTEEKARRLIAASRPDLIIAECSETADPMIWVREAHQLDLAAQVIAVADQPDFDKSMDWVAGGIFNVITKPVDERRIRRLALAALENSEAFKALTEKSADSGNSGVFDLSRCLADFYHGLSGRLESTDLKKYIIGSVKRLTNAKKVELCLTDTLFEDSCCLETFTITGSDNDPSDLSLAGHHPDLVSIKCRLGFELTYGGQHLGDIYLYFDNKNDLAIRDREVMLEMISAISGALASVAKYQSAVKLAARDGLTGLYNRRIFNEVLKREFAQAQRYNYSICLLSLDLDHFKSVNDNFGHQTGDLVLKAVAEVISNVARKTDCPARLGGEEFAVILPHTNQEQALIVAQRLKDMLAQSDFNLDGTVFRQTISQGIAGLEHFMVKSPEDMVYWADQALYLAKREGRDTIRSASDISMTPTSKDRPYAFQ